MLYHLHVKLNGSVRVSVLTVRADAADFDRVLLRLETFRGSRSLDRLADAGIVQFRHRAATSAQQKLAGYRVTGVTAADEGVERRQAMHQSLVGEKVERPVYRRWCGCASFIGEYFKNGVSAERPVAAPDYLQHPCA